MHMLQEDIWIHVLEDIDTGLAVPKITKEQAHDCLKRRTRADFGYDTAAWRKWFRENEPTTISWFTLSDIEYYICIIEGCSSYQISSSASKQQALIKLRNMTGVDFGFDSTKWREWFRVNEPEISRRFVYG